MPYLAELTERWTANGEDRRSPLRAQARDLSWHMVSAWPTEAWYPHNGKEPSEAAHMLAVLTRLADTPRIEALLAKSQPAAGTTNKTTVPFSVPSRSCRRTRARRRGWAPHPADRPGVAQCLR